MAKGEDSNRAFVPIEDAKESRMLMREGAKVFASTIIWTKDQEQVVNTHLVGYTEEQKTIYAWMPKNFNPDAFIRELQKIKDPSCYFSVSLTRANIFFKTKFKDINQEGLAFEYPEQIYKVQRRKDFRMPVPDGYAIKIEVEDPLFPENKLQKKVYDISAGGISFIVKTDEEAMFTVGLKLRNIRFQVRSRDIKCDAEVKHIKMMTNTRDAKPPGVKIGLQLQNLKPADAQHIASYVFEESRKYFSRFI
ncbi:MAG: flagellar brake protein [Bacteriovoracia bacterium]